MRNTLGLRRTVKELGNLLAGWLNKFGKVGGSRPPSEPAFLIGILLGMAQKEGPDGETLQQKFERFWERFEHFGDADTNIPRHERPIVLDPEMWECNIRLFIRPHGDVLDFGFRPEGEVSEAFWSFARLIQLGFVDRVRSCRHCNRFFFAVRADSKLCSQRCRENAWRKTQAGRKARAAYMREYRANPRVRALNGAPKGYCRKRGRKLHVDLKKGD